MFGLKSTIYLTLFLFPMFACHVFAEELSPSTEVQANMTILLETKNCPQCNLRGADLNRMDLTEANLEGANLSRAKMSLTNLSGANLQNTDLREAVFYGADLANADLRGADLTGVNLVGAYIVGALMDGEMVVTTPYEHDGISDIEETVYVEDTVNPKAPQETEEMTIGSRRDFEETPPVVPEKKVQIETVKSTPNMKPVENMTLAYDDESLPKQSPAAPAAKVAPAIQTVSIGGEMADNEVLLTDDTKKQPSTEAAIVQVDPQQDAVNDTMSTDAAFLENNQTQTANDGEQERGEKKAAAFDEMSSVASTEELGQLPQDFPPSAKESDTDGPANNDQDKQAELSGSESGLQTVSTDSTVEDQSAGMVQTVLNLFSSDEPSTEILRNVALLLDTNRCYGCNLVGVDLSGENLDSADLESADLSNAILKDVDLEGANLKEANLTGADLSGADLSEADLYKANLTNADLTDADLEDTLLDYVNFSGVKGYKKQTMMLMEQN